MFFASQGLKKKNKKRLSRLQISWQKISWNTRGVYLKPRLTNPASGAITPNRYINLMTHRHNLI